MRFIACDNRMRPVISDMCLLEKVVSSSAGLRELMLVFQLLDKNSVEEGVGCISRYSLGFESALLLLHRYLLIHDIQHWKCDLL